MYVCEECHKKDNNVTKCDIKLADHVMIYCDKCEICGKECAVYLCALYAGIGEIENVHMREMSREG